MASTLTLVGKCRYQGADICVYRDQNNKYFVEVNGIPIQGCSTADEMARCLLNQMNDVQLNRKQRRRLTSGWQ